MEVGPGHGHPQPHDLTLAEGAVEPRGQVAGLARQSSVYLSLLEVRRRGRTASAIDRRRCGNCPKEAAGRGAVRQRRGRSITTALHRNDSRPHASTKWQTRFEGVINEHPRAASQATRSRTGSGASMERYMARRAVPLLRRASRLQAPRRSAVTRVTSRNIMEVTQRPHHRGRSDAGLEEIGRESRACDRRSETRPSTSATRLHRQPDPQGDPLTRLQLPAWTSGLEYLTLDRA